MNTVVISTFAGSALDISNTYSFAKFKDYRFLEVFYPTRGILEWYDRASGKRQPLPGADDPHYVQTDGVWSPDGKGSAEAKDPYPVGQPKALHANDPNETQIQYDLYRVPFNDGRGGIPEPIAGASHNGMSNNFPKVSQDGRWIVFVRSLNGQLMRPDSQLYIVPFGGGDARRLPGNTRLMNSWHSFSPNGRWLVFSSRARSFHTRLYQTHIDEQGNSSPAILIDNATAANRAVNLPEFVNTAGDGIEEIQVPAVDQYKVIDEATQLEQTGDHDHALQVWEKAVALDPGNGEAQNGLGVSLYHHGEVNGSFQHLREALRINPLSVEDHFVLGKFMLDQDHPEQALVELQEVVAIRPQFQSCVEALASAYEALGKSSGALVHWRKAQIIDPSSASAMIGAAWLLATTSDAALRNGAEAVRLSQSAMAVQPGNPEVLDTLAAAYAEGGQFSRASSTETHPLELAKGQANEQQTAAIRAHRALFAKQMPFREDRTHVAAGQTSDTWSALKSGP